MSVIVVNRRRYELLDHALRSLRNQTIPAEVVVVDNESSLESDAVAQRYPEVQLIRNPRNEGFCRANNQGIAAARGDFIALLNNDAEAEPGWLESLLACFRDASVGMAASKILLHADPRIIDKAGHLIFPDGQNRGRGSGQVDAGQFDAEEEVLWPDGCAAMYRKSMLDQVGAFDEDLFAYGDDAELGLRARIAGWRCIYAPRAVVRHRRSSTLGVASWKKIALIERNRVLLAVRHFPVTLLWRNGFYYALRLWEGVRAAARGEGEAALFTGVSGKAALAFGLVAGDVGALCMMPLTIRKRMRRPELRRLTPRQVHDLILGNGISARELSTRAAIV